ncbi:DUF6165 family protein [Variovorax ureilyticus]|uniref:DUF6165 family protein n=1 Tax=Variovorax ureilyticus TaxID=1836198 RepID=UPI003D679460
MHAPVLVPVSPGELFDKKTILEIKLQRVTDESKLVFVRRELDLLSRATAEVLKATSEAAAIEQVQAELLAINMRLWDIENEMRHAERESRFDARFIEAARQVYLTNDRRAALKQRINALLGSELDEVKEHR